MDDSLAQRKCVLFFLEGDLMTPAPPLGVENLKIRENSEKNRGPPGVT